MGIRLRVGEAQGFVPLDPVRWYPARVTNIAEDEVPFKGQPQPKFRFDFVVLDPPEFVGRELDGLVNQPQGGEVNERHTLYDWITALRGGVPLSLGDEIDFPDQFIGKIVYVQVENRTKTYEGGQPFTFQNVKKLAACPDAARFEHLCPLASGQPAASSSPQSAPGAGYPSATPATPAAPIASPAAPTPAATPQLAPGVSGAAPASPTTPAGYPPTPAPAPQPEPRPAPVQPPAPAPAPQAPPAGATVQVGGQKKKVPF